MTTLPPLTAETAAAIFAGLLGAALALDRIRRLWRRSRRAKWARAQADLSALRAMTPSEFEAYTAAAFEARGWRVEIVGREGRADGGLDLLMFGRGRRVVVQCKRYAAKVGAPVIRETMGVMMHHKAQGAYVVALSGFTRAAQAWAAGKPVKLINGGQLLKAIKANNRKI
jgi:restriction system protein